MKSFENWTFEDVEDTFEIVRIKNHKTLTNFAGFKKQLQ